MPTLISNYNDYVRWDKTDCNQYTITSLDTEFEVEVTVTDLTPGPSVEGPWIETFVLAIGASTTVTVPGDGVFQVCAHRIDSPINLYNPVPAASRLCRISIPQVEIIVSVTAVTSGIPTIISVGADFSSPPASYAALLIAIQVYINANGGGTVYMLEPGVGNDRVPAIVGFYQLVSETVNVDLYTIVYSNGGDDFSQFCSSDFTAINPTRPWVFSCTIGGTEVLTEPWDLSTQAGCDFAVSEITTFFGTPPAGFATASPVGIYININREDCSEVVLQLGNYGAGPDQCDYIYEFCALYACLSRLMNKWLCQDPCANECSPVADSREEARRKAVDLSTMFFHGLMPLVSQERMWHLGNWNVSTDRTCNINNILLLFERMRSYVANCGFDCGCGCGNPCEPCDPCDGQSYQSSLSNPTTPCGCK
jgi:hypothetical protein